MVVIQLQWTCGKIEEARDIARWLVENRLVACVNIFPQVESYFFWEGECQTEVEVKILMKSTLEKFERVKEVIEAKSSYELPEITYLIVDGGSRTYLEWVDQNVQG